MIRKRFIIIIYIAVILFPAGVPTVFSDGKLSNVRKFLPCPDEWLTDARFFVDRGLLPGVLIMVDTTPTAAPIPLATAWAPAGSLPAYSGCRRVTADGWER